MRDLHFLCLKNDCSNFKAIIYLSLTHTHTKIHKFSFQLTNGFFFATVFLQKQPPEVFCKKSVLRNFTKFTKKHLFLLKKRPQHRCFPVNFAKFLRTPFLQNTSGRLLFAVFTRSGQIIFRIFWKYIIIIFLSNMNLIL